MVVYFAQLVMSGAMKIGYSKAVVGRMVNLQNLGPAKIIGVIPHGTFGTEKLVFERLWRWRIQAASGTDRDEPFEVFAPIPDVFDYCESEELLSMGYLELHKLIRHRNQTAKEWLSLQQLYFPLGSDQRWACDLALESNARLRKKVPKTARGGWDLNEAIGGIGSPWMQLGLPSMADKFGLDGSGRLVRAVKYGDGVFPFPIIAEWYEREQRKKAPPGAIWFGTPVKPKLELEEETLKKRRELRRYRRQLASQIPGQIDWCKGEPKKDAQ